MKTYTHCVTDLVRAVVLAIASFCAIVVSPYQAHAEQPILNLEKTGDGSLRLYWDAEAGKTYRLTTKTNLNSSTPWTQVGEDIVGDSSPAEVFVFPTMPRAFFRLVKDVAVGGSILLQQGQVLSGTVTINTAAFTSSSNVVVAIELIDIDVATGQTNVYSPVAAVGATNASFEIDTSNMQNGPHELRIKVTDDTGGDFTEYANEELSNPVTVTVRNDIYCPDEHVMLTSSMLMVEFGTLVQDGIWRVEIYDEEGVFYGGAEDDIASSVDSQGHVAIADYWIDDGNGGVRPRNWYDGYPNEYFDILIFVWPTGSARPAFAKQTKASKKLVLMHAPAFKGGKSGNGPTPNAAGPTTPVMKYVRSRISHRPSQRLSMVVEYPIIPRAALRNNMNTLMDTAYVGYSPLSRHMNLRNLSTDHNQQPSAEGWGFIEGPQSWTNLNGVLAGGPNVAYGGSDRVTIFYYFGHGFIGGIGTTNGGVGGAVTPATLQSLGYWETSNHIFVITGPPPFSGTIKAKFYVKRAGCTFTFLDACNAATLLKTLAINVNYKHSGKPTLSDLVNDGDFPYYGCGWTKLKVAGVRHGQDVDFGHFDYSARFISSTLTQDPATGLPANTYHQAREIARFWSSSPGVINPGALGWDEIGCGDLFIDE